MLNNRIRDGIHANVAMPMPTQCTHKISSPRMTVPTHPCPAFGLNERDASLHARIAPDSSFVLLSVQDYARLPVRHVRVGCQGSPSMPQTFHGGTHSPAIVGSSPMTEDRE